MSDPTDDEIGAYYDRAQAHLVDDLPEDGRAYLRAKYIRDVRANPEAMRQLRERLGRESHR